MFLLGFISELETTYHILDVPSRKKLKSPEIDSKNLKFHSLIGNSQKRPSPNYQMRCENL